MTARARLLAPAVGLARATLCDLPDRWAHSQAASLRAGRAADTLGLDVDLVAAAAVLHDIGYAEPLRFTGFHPWDGARHLSLLGWPVEIVRLVAHHSHAALVAPYEGVADQYAKMGLPDASAAAVLAWADLTAGVEGRGSTVLDRINDMRARHADRVHVPVRVREGRYRQLAETASRVEHLLQDAERGVSAAT